MISPHIGHGIPGTKSPRTNAQFGQKVVMKSISSTAMILHSFDPN